mgnify:FL=1
MREGYNNMHGKIIHGNTPEERFKEVHGMTIEKWIAKEREKFAAKTGMSPDEWYIKQINSLAPIDFLKKHTGAVSEKDIKLVKELQQLGLNDGVINVLLDYAGIVNRIGFIHSLVKRMCEILLEKDILTIESAINFFREKGYE